jgi:hypothetical protein
MQKDTLFSDAHCILYRGSPYFTVNIFNLTIDLLIFNLLKTTEP